jgi:undecaprenyl-diphosphatase
MKVPALITVLFVILAGVTAARHGTPYALDAAGHRWALAHRDHATVDVAIAVTDTGTGVVAYALAALAGAFSGWGTWWRGAFLGAAILAVGQVLRLALAVWIGRSRPPAADWASAAGGPAMPSGHTSSATIVAILLLYYLHQRTRNRAVLALPVLWAVAVGFTRVYLGMHWITDVIAGFLFAIAWTTAIITLFTSLQGRNS